ncbi:uncharacterized protein TOT_010001006 [Theileria orientalis strain Shintoku]|uniref:WW domain-containing protein n=1 Tax=Theileria orientalis strain Shintoku TaxID=869250 RepID=J4C2Z5_THEOR|nr:uncharacterized protein TOT_010001006 [Theileria orientalis strain Shintoku]BAM39551.1 uncharacterized protein TOT_010001006 [Theileria orientalis strain Shintoku]|eukprot:XP_009689852.1 uncharacterized protein TOT_010001006 [Theileria orientalis strain Shintoku]
MVNDTDGDVGVPVSWKQMEESSWYEVETSGNFKYYYNRETKETRWDKPSIKKPQKKEVEEPEEVKIPQEDLDEYKELVKSLNLPNNVGYEQTIPKLLFDPRYKKIPQSHRKRLFNQLRRELLEESTSTPHTLELLESLEPKEKESGKRKLDQSKKPRESHKRRVESHQESHRDAHLRKMAEDNFLSLLYEKVKMPFRDGEVEPMDDELLSSDPRYSNEHLENRRYLYKKFTRDFLADRVRLFESKLAEIDPFGHDLEEAVELLGTKLFGHLPIRVLERSLDKYKHEKKEEFVDSFKKMLKQSLFYKAGAREDNLKRAKLKFFTDQAELEHIHKSSKNISLEDD